VRHAVGEVAQRKAETVEQFLGEEYARLALEDLSQVLGVVVESVKNELLEPFASEFDQGPECLRGEDRINDHRERAVAVADGADPVGPGSGLDVELWVYDENVDGLAADDGVGVSPVQRGMDTMPVSRRPLKADELVGLDAGGDVHLDVVRLTGWGQNDYNAGTKARFFGTKQE
jgi:hypothetical protein